MFSRNQIVLITGGIGFIGKHLLRQLLQVGKTKIYLIDDLSNSSKSDLYEFSGADIRFIEHDVSHPLPDLGIEIDTVFHLAALVSVPDSFNNPLRTHQVNETGFINVLEFCRTHNVKKLVYASSCAVYGSSTALPLNETEKVVPESPYGLTKLNNEYYARFANQSFGLESIGLRFFNVYGPGQKPNSAYAGVISIFMDKVIKGEEPLIYGDGSQTRDFVYVEDIAKALVAASMSDQTCAVYNVGTGKSTSVKTLFETIAEIADSDLQPKYEAARLGDVEASCADIDKLARELNFRASYSLKSGLENLYESLISSKSK